MRISVGKARKSYNYENVTLEPPGLFMATVHFGYSIGSLNYRIDIETCLLRRIHKSIIMRRIHLREDLEVHM